MMFGKAICILSLLAGSWLFCSGGEKQMSVQKETVLELFHSKQNPRNSEGSFCTLKNGDIIFVYTHFYGGAGDHAGANLAMRRSSDGGRTWSSQDEIVVHNKKNNVMSASLLRLQDGRIGLFFLQKSSPGGVLMCTPMVSFSADEAKTWSKPKVAKDAPGYLVVNNDRVIQLKSGRLLMPIAYHRMHTKKVVDIRGIAYFFISDDGGAVWRESRELIFHPSSKSRCGLQEPGVIELADGRLMAWFRTGEGAQYKSFSTDSGDTWSPACRAEEFLSPEAPLSMKRNPATGELFSVWCDWNPDWKIARNQRLSWGRTPLVLARSKDDGKTWQDHVLLESEPDHGYCYIAMHFTENALLLAYCCGGGKKSSVLQDMKIVRIELDSMR